jgi:cephalosporin-C deacetylase-like acetyl esterase
MKRISILTLLLVIVSYGLIFAQADEDLDVLTDWLHYTDAENTLYHHLAGEAYSYLEQRKSEIRSLNTIEQWESYQLEIQNKIHDIIGPFPDKTPLNPRITGTIERPDFTVEKIIYESQPGFFVTAVLLIPGQMTGPAPAVIYASGHTANGFRSEVYQRKIINLVKKGFVVLAFDPVSQGERLQYFDEENGRSAVGGATSEHSYAGAQMFLTGSSLARYMIWDGIRAVDYLQTRSEVDPNRIGITGRSGGGTQSSYIAALDDRIAASAPENYITSLEYLLKSRGPQDAEQNFYHGIANGIDHADLLLSFAPKPSMIIATTRDFFSIQGARETFEEVQRFYDTAGKPDHFSIVEDDHGHGSTLANREAMYAFFQEHLDHPESSEDLPVEFFTDEELQVTETGQIVTSIKGETLFSLQSRESGQLINRLVNNRGSIGSHIEMIREQSKILSGYREPQEQGPEVFAGRYVRDTYDIEKYFISGEGDYPVPYLMFRPHEPNDKLIVYLHPDGKAAEAGIDGEIARLAEQGYHVVVPDLPGIGEMGPGLPQGDSYIGNVSYNIFFGAVQIGRSIPGLRAGDVNRLISTVTSMKDVAADEITILAKGTLTSEAVHAAAFNENISNVILNEPLVSYESIVMNEKYDPEWVHSLIPGALVAYDLPDLAATVAPRRLLIINPVDENSDIISNAADLSDFEVIRSAFRNYNESEKIGIENSGEEFVIERILEWLSNP